MAQNPRYQPLSPADYLHIPWKNGGGVSTTIAGERLPGVAPGDWSGVIWQLGRTQIVAPAPFSDLTGFDRVQIVIGGSGLVLETPAGDIDLREPFRPARYDGGIPIISRLENGPVEVVNLIGRRDLTRIDMVMLDPGADITLPAAQHLVYAPAAAARLCVDDEELELATNHAVAFDKQTRLRVMSGTAILASIAPR